MRFELGNDNWMTVWLDPFDMAELEIRRKGRCSDIKNANGLGTSRNPGSTIVQRTKDETRREGRVVVHKGVHLAVILPKFAELPVIIGHQYIEQDETQIFGGAGGIVVREAVAKLEVVN